MITTVNRPSAEQAQEIVSGKFLFFGIAMVVLGALAIAASVLTTMGTVMILGGIMAAAGIAECIHALRARRRENMFFNLLSALLYIGVGGMMLYNPIVGALGLTLIVSAFLFVAGIIRFMHGIMNTEERPWGWFVFGGMVDMTLAVLIMLGWPASALWVIGLFVGLEMIIYGFTTMALASAIKELEQARRAFCH